MRFLNPFLFVVVCGVFFNVPAALPATQFELSRSNDSLDEITPAVSLSSKRSFDVLVDAEFLYWFGNVTNLPFARKMELTPLGDTTNPSDATLTPLKTENLDWSWDPGLRLGLGVVTNHDGWDVHAGWTYFYNSVQASAGVSDYPAVNFTSTTFNPPGTQVLTSPWLFLPHRDHFNRIEADWSLLFNKIDLVLGRAFWLSPRLSVRPFSGIRGYWSRMDFTVVATRPAIPRVVAFQNFINSRSRSLQKSWAVGLLGGLNTSWYFATQWSLIGAADVALCYGKYTVNRKIRQFQVQETNNLIFRDLGYTTKDAAYKMQPFVDLELGIRWETPIKDRYSLQLDLGWESHFMVNFSQAFFGTFESDSTTDFPSTKGNLTLSGIVMHGRFVF